MPAFGPTFSAQQVRDVAQYVRREIVK